MNTSLHIEATVHNIKSIHNYSYWNEQTPNIYKQILQHIKTFFVLLSLNEYISINYTKQKTTQACIQTQYAITPSKAEQH